MNEEWWRMIISSCWGVLIYDWWTNEQSFVNVELLLRLKIILHQSTVNYKDKWFFFECIVFLVYMMHAIIIWLFTSCIFNHCNVILNYGEYHWFIIYINVHKYAIVLHFICEVKTFFLMLSKFKCHHWIPRKKTNHFHINCVALSSPVQKLWCYMRGNFEWSA